MKRLLTALVLIPIVAYVVLLAHSWLFLAVLVTVSLLSYHEYNKITGNYGFGDPGPLGFGFGLLLLAWKGEAWMVIVAAALVGLCFAMRASDLAQVLPRSALLVTGVVYVFGCWKCAIPLREANPHWLMYALLVNWTGDAGAYYIGRKYGRHRLAPRVSPKKSWEGAIASVAASVLLAGAYLMAFVGVSAPVAIALTVAVNAAGQLGDLVESAMKRGAGVKDSSSILPGHGGFLDRVDSTLFALPVLLAYLKLTA